MPPRVVDVTWENSGWCHESWCWDTGGTTGAGAYQSPYQDQSPFGQPDWSQAYQAPAPVVPPVSQHQDSWHQPEFSHVTSTTLGGMHHHPAFLQSNHRDPSP